MLKLPLKLHRTLCVRSSTRISRQSTGTLMTMAILLCLLRTILTKVKRNSTGCRQNSTRWTSLIQLSSTWSSYSQLWAINTWESYSQGEKQSQRLQSATLPRRVSLHSLSQQAAETCQCSPSLLITYRQMMASSYTMKAIKTPKSIMRLNLWQRKSDLSMKTFQYRRFTRKRIHKIWSSWSRTINSE